MALVSTSETVAIIYDIENAPIEMLQFTIEQVKRYDKKRVIVVSDWEAHPEQQRWKKLMEYPDFTFRQINRTFHGKNSLDSALYDSACTLYQEGVRRYFIITTDSDFIDIAKHLNSNDKSYIIGVGTEQASEKLRNAYDEFLVFNQSKGRLAVTNNKNTALRNQSNLSEESTQVDTMSNISVKAVQAPKASKVAKSTKPTKNTKTSKNVHNTKNSNGVDNKIINSKIAEAKVAVSEIDIATQLSLENNNALSINLSVRIPRTLKNRLEVRRQEEGVSMDELMTFFITQCLALKD